MSVPPLSGVRACVFDAYGTLFDHGSALAGCSSTLGDRTTKLTVLWREKQLQYTWLLAAQQRHVDFWQVTSDALEYALDALEIDDPGIHRYLMSRYLSLRPFSEVPATLKRLKKAGLKIAILSNGTPGMLTAAVTSGEIAELVDLVLSVELVGIFKPHPRVYQLAVDRLGLEASAISFQSSNAWDAYAASAFGMRAVWCNRTGQSPEFLPGEPDAEITTLAALPSLVGA